jgi:acid-sensing ion channel, other
VTQVCDSDMLYDVDPKNKTDCDKCAGILKFLMGDADQCFKHCRHLYTTDKYKDLFKEVVTEGGVCFVFNSFEVFRKSNESLDDTIEEWTLEGGYKNNTGHIDIHPRAGSKFALNMGFTVNQRMTDSLCKGGIQAFKVYLHLPNEAPQIAKHFYLLPFYQYTQFYLNPKVTITVPELRDFPVEKRQCYFSDERYLRFFKQYTQNNCEVECVVNQTLSRCGCLMFYMPSEWSNAKTLENLSP